MRHLITIVLLFATIAVVAWSYKKYKDPPPGTDPRLTNPYCNDPLAVNYNWGFPGKPDNTICFYPSDLFVGNYFYYDSVYISSSGLFISADSFYVSIVRASTANKTSIAMTGNFCGGSGLTIAMTANVGFTAVVDTTIGDTLTLHQGQQFCHAYDTLTGTIDRDRIDSTLLHFNLQVVSDTTTYSHIGHAVKK